jgi:hypothetical protein
MTLQTSLNTPIQATGAGTSSVVLGHNAMASGALSIAISSGATIASGSPSIAIGRSCNAGGNNSVTIGRGCTASGNDSVAIGLGTTSGDSTISIGSGTTSNDGDIIIGSGAVSNSSIAIGPAVNASGALSIAIGNDAISSGENGIAIGVQSVASGENGIAIGDNAEASAVGIAIGLGANVSATSCTAIGSGASANTANNCVAIGENSQASGTAGEYNIWSIGHFANNTIPGSMLLGGNAGSTPLNLIWNDNAADLGTSPLTTNKPFGTLYVNNAVQLAPPSVTAYSVDLGPQTILATLSLIIGALGGMTILTNPGSYFTLDNTTPTNPKLKYTGTVSRFFDVSFMIGYYGTGLSENVSLYLVVNSTASPSAPSDVTCSFKGGATPILTNQTLRKIIQLDQNDYIWFAMQTNQLGSYNFGPCSITATQI